MILFGPPEIANPAPSGGLRGALGHSPGQISHLRRELPCPREWTSWGKAVRVVAQSQLTSAQARMFANSLFAALHLRSENAELKNRSQPGASAHFCTLLSDTFVARVGFCSFLDIRRGDRFNV